jgi:hypothetical protein
MVSVRVRLACLAFALLWAQWLGLSHAIWHSPVGQASSAHAEATQGAAKPHAHAGDSHAVLEAPEWLSHHSDSECRLFDQLAHSDGLITASQNLGGLAPCVLHLVGAVVQVQHQWLLAYRARAPPLFLS